MSSTLDTNVLLYASDESSSYHRRALELLETVAAGPDLVYLFWPVALSYLRIATHPAIFAKPLSTHDAIANVGDLVSRPHVRTCGEAEGFWESYQQVVASTPARGNLVPDAHLVALMRQNGVSTIWSHDRDFRKFDGVAVRDPFD
jgi:toxin-antitoxin system PIN domain toxin